MTFFLPVLKIFKAYNLYQKAKQRKLPDILRSWLFLAYFIAPLSTFLTLFRKKVLKFQGAKLLYTCGVFTKMCCMAKEPKLQKCKKYILPVLHQKFAVWFSREFQLCQKIQPNGWLSVKEQEWE